jgi:hypothetical protein
MCLGLMQPENEYMDEKWMCSQWQFFKNPGANKKLSRKDRITTPAIPLCTMKTKYNGKYLNISASKLQENTLYTSNVHNAALVDALLVSHSAHVVFAFQSSNVDANIHAFNFNTIHNVWTGLQLHTEENRNYKLYYIYCGDSSKKSESGFDIQNLPTDSAAVEALTSRLITGIARVRYYPRIADVELQ